MKLTKLPKQDALRVSQETCLKLLQEFESLCAEHNITYWIDGGTLLGAERHQGFIPWDDDIDVCIPIKDYQKVLKLLSEKTASNPSRFVYFVDSEFDTWCEFYADTSYLIDGALPSRIDLIPVKYIPNSPQSLAEDKSFNQLARIYMRGEAKDNSAILDEHKAYLPKGKDLPAEKKNFFRAYFDYMIQSSEKAVNDSEYLVTYSYHDALVVKDRGYYSSNDLFPLQKIEFERFKFNCPLNKHAYLVSLYGDNYMQLPPEDKRLTHLTFLYTNPNISKQDLKFFLEHLHQYGYLNLALGKRNIRRWKKIYRGLNFIRFTMSLFFRLKFSLVGCLFRYSKIHLSR
jgi:lipopolysaccharide cholinephosphotransferase